MKKFSFFLISFIILFSLLTFSAEVLSGVFLTLAYTPDIDEAWNMSAVFPWQTEIYSNGSPFLLILAVALLSASLSYFLAQKFAKRMDRNVK